MSEEEKTQNEIDIEKTVSADKVINKYLSGDEFLNDMLGLELRPLTLSSLAMMQEAGCQIISGVNVDEMENMMLEILLFVYIHSADQDNLTKAICSSANPREALKMEALSMGLDISPKQIPTLVEEILKILTEATDTKVDPLPDEDDGTTKKKEEGE